ncbi:MAG: hypothetical protein H6Q90_1709 [Deltaproteobacteria bacterium]|nr:hypothetical protein [Deltaproteobacteria bacterium]
MSTTTEATKQGLLDELTAEHRRLDERLQLLEKRRALTPSEQEEITTIKKQKLLTKDRIARLS